MGNQKKQQWRDVMLLKNGNQDIGEILPSSRGLSLVEGEVIALNVPASPYYQVSQVSKDCVQVFALGPDTPKRPSKPGLNIKMFEATI